MTTSQAADIASVALVRPGSSTHAFNFEQRLVDLGFTAGNGTLTLTSPPNANIAPPGYYMLFLINRAGVPSQAAWVRLASNPNNQPPRGTITTPSGDVTIEAGQTVTFAGSGTDPDGDRDRLPLVVPGRHTGHQHLGDARRDQVLDRRDVRRDAGRHRQRGRDGSEPAPPPDHRAARRGSSRRSAHRRPARPSPARSRSA